MVVARLLSEATSFAVHISRTSASWMNRAGSVTRGPPSSDEIMQPFAHIWRASTVTLPWLASHFPCAIRSSVADYYTQSFEVGSL